MEKDRRLKLTEAVCGRQHMEFIPGVYEEEFFCAEEIFGVEKASCQSGALELGGGQMFHRYRTQLSYLSIDRSSSSSSIIAGKGGRSFGLVGQTPNHSMIVYYQRFLF